MYTAKIKQKFPFEPKKYMSFPDKHPEVIYILVSIKLHIGNDTDKGHYICDVLDYNTETWCNCDDDRRTQHPGYPMNVYDSLSIDEKKEKKKKKCAWMNQIVLCQFNTLKKNLASSTYYFIIGKSAPK